MENEKPALEILKEFAKRSGRQMEYTEVPYTSTPLHPVTYHRRTVIMRNYPGADTFFVCFADSREVSIYNVFSGIFIPVGLPSSTRIELRAKDILDKLNPFLKSKIETTGNQKFDSEFVITGNDHIRVSRIFNSKDIQGLVRSSLKLDQKFKIGINTYDLDFVPELAKQSHFGVYIQEEWILESKKLESLFGLMEEFSVKMKSYS